MTYRIRPVDGFDDEVADTIIWLDTLCFGDTAPRVNPEEGLWWLAFYQREPVAYAGMQRSHWLPFGGYLCRSGVLEEHRGHGLQVRLLRTREKRARRIGWTALVTDTTDNVASGNSLIKAGYRLFEPQCRWAFSTSNYWRKKLV